MPIRRPLFDELRALRLFHHRFYGRLPTVGDLIFLTPRGKPWVDARRNALRLLRETLENAGVLLVDGRGRKVDIHALRHTFASRLARAGVPLQKAQRLLGHSDPKLTAAIYTHLETEDLRDAVDAMAEVLPAFDEPPYRGRKCQCPPMVSKTLPAPTTQVVSCKRLRWRARQDSNLRPPV